MLTSQSTTVENRTVEDMAFLTPWRKVEAMLWLGDNIYLREADFGSLSGFVHRYTHTRSLPEMQSLLSKGAHYAIWDDHDFGPNDCDGSWIHPDWSRVSFDAFWLNPASGIPAATELNTTHFLYGDVEFSCSTIVRIVSITGWDQKTSPRRGSAIGC